MTAKPVIATVLGARPQFIKAAPVAAALRDKATEIVINTGQHYDRAMAGDFFDELGLAAPNHDLGIGSGSHGSQTGRMLEAIERTLVEEDPGAVMVYGDTNTTLAGALAAAKLNIPVAHVEAGLRSFRRSMPEEINRTVVDHLAVVNLCPTGAAVQNLANEGITQGVHLVGDVMVDAALAAMPLLTTARVRALGVPDEYVSATLHRPQNVDDRSDLQTALDLFAAVPYPVAVAVHPRTHDSLERHQLRWPGNVVALPPLGYLDMLSLVRHSRALLTDSGGLQKEAIIVGTPCIVLRDETEWVETVDAGVSRLVGLDAAAAVDAIASMPVPDPGVVADLFPPGASQLVADLVVEVASQGAR